MFTVAVIAHDVVWNFKQIPEISATVVLLSTIDKKQNKLLIIIDKKLRNNTNKKMNQKLKTWSCQEHIRTDN